MFTNLKKKLAEIEAMSVNDPSVIPSLVDGCRMEIELLENGTPDEVATPTGDAEEPAGDAASTPSTEASTPG